MNRYKEIISNNEKKDNKKRIKLLLVASSGGHLIQLYSLKDFWSKYDRIWATFKTPQTQSLLVDQGENVVWLKHPTNVRTIKDWRYVINSFVNVFILWWYMLKYKVTHVVSTGAAPSVSAVWTAKILFLGRIKTVYIDSFTRPFSMSFSAKLNYFVADVMLTQWPHMAKKYKRLKYKGKVL